MWIGTGSRSVGELQSVVEIKARPQSLTLIGPAWAVLVNASHIRDSRMQVRSKLGTKPLGREERHARSSRINIKEMFE
jgi:hypothetical protein